jgi:glycosyltransferase involved in cell wall biosynthesis
MRIAFYTSPHWAFGSIHSALCNRLSRFSIEAEILDATIGHPIDSFNRTAMSFDYVVTDPGASVALADSYGVPRGNIVLISHGEEDLHRLIKRHGTSVYSQFIDFAVVSESLFSSALTLGLRTPGAVLPLGVSTDLYDADVASGLSVVGYAAAMSRENTFGVEGKRGRLAKEAAEKAGLLFRPATDLAGHRMSLSYQQMPEYYKSVDAVLMSSLQEGAGLPVIEAAAAGRLVIGTPVGHFPRLAYNGGGLLAPLGDQEFVDYSVSALKFYKANPVEYRNKCILIKKAAKRFDWDCVIEHWATFFLGLRRK